TCPRARSWTTRGSRCERACHAHRHNHWGGADLPRRAPGRLVGTAKVERLMLPLLGVLLVEWTVAEVAAFAALAVSVATAVSTSLTAAETAQRIRKAKQDAAKGTAT